MAAAWLLAAGSAGAGEATPLSREILVTATRIEREARETGATVSVVTREEFEARQARRAVEALRSVPGAYVSAGGPPGSPSSLFLRGAASNQAVVLVDGVKVNDPTLGGQFNFFDLGLLGVSRIEVLKGGASTLYGSEAIGGVVNVVGVRFRGRPRGRVRGEGGSHGHYLFEAAGGGTFGAFDLGGGVSRSRWRNDRPDNGFLRDTWVGRIGCRVSDGLYAWGTVRTIEARVQDPWDFPFGAQIPRDGNLRRRRNTTLGSLGLTHDVSEEFRWTVRGSILDVNSLLRNGPDRAGDPDELRSRAEAQVRTVTCTGTFSPGNLPGGVEVTVLLGFEYEDEISENRVASPFGESELDRTVRNRAAFVLAQAEIPERVTVSGGLRRDRNSFFGYETTASASLLCRAGSVGPRLRANYGEGFRAPEPIEFDDPFVGNPGLSPEASTSLDVGLSQDLLEGAVELAVTWFQLRTTDLIAYSPETFRLENFRKTRTRGVEGSVRVRPAEGWHLRAYATVQNPRDLSARAGEESRLPGRPRSFGGGEIGFEGGGLTALLTLDFSGDFPAAGRVTPDGRRRDHPGRKLLLALAASLALSERATLFARVENLLDDAWYDSDLAPDGLGRGFHLGLEVRF